MPFGKNKKLSMPRAKKKKREPLETINLINNDTGITGAQSPARVGGDLVDLVEDAPSSPGLQLRQEAKQRKLEACVELEVAQAALKKAEERLSVERRLFSIKVDRLDAGEKRKKKPSPAGVLNRGYKAWVSMLKAELAASRAAEAYAEAK